MIFKRILRIPFALVLVPVMAIVLTLPWIFDTVTQTTWWELVGRPSIRLLTGDWENAFGNDDEDPYPPYY